MAIYIPEWNKFISRYRHVKRDLNKLSDEYIIRRRISHGEESKDIFIQLKNKYWIVFGFIESSFKDLNSLSLEGDDSFYTSHIEPFNIRCSETGGIKKFLILMQCSSEEAKSLHEKYIINNNFGIRLMSKGTFLTQINNRFSGLFTNLSKSQNELLLSYYFPETEISYVGCVRRDYHRDYDAKVSKIYLDNQQEWASKLDLEQPEELDEISKDLTVRLINGVAGSGKTLIALNRAILLAKLYPQKKVLFLIHNTPIVADLKDRLQRSQNGEIKNLEITTFFSWVFSQWRNIFSEKATMPKSDKEALKIISLSKHRFPELKYSEQQLFDELNFLNDQMISSEGQYLDANRAGQGFALRAADRIMIWSLHEEIRSTLLKSGKRLWSSLPYDVALNKNIEKLRKYRFILVDEAQFFAPSWFNVLKKAQSEGGSLFLCADPNQGFMKSRLSWKSVGLDVAGRTKKLHRSYRTTQSILRAANYVLARATHDDPDDYLEPNYEGMVIGDKPLFIVKESQQGVLQQVVNEITELYENKKISLSNMLIVFGENKDKFSLVEFISKNIGEENIWWLNKYKKEPPLGFGKEYLRIVSLETATGLEANIVFLIGMERLMSNYRSPLLSDEEYTQLSEEKARKTYMAMTRAGSLLVILSSEDLPEDYENFFYQPDVKEKLHLFS